LLDGLSLAWARGLASCAGRSHSALRPDWTRIAVREEHVTAVTAETFPQQFPSGTVVGGPYIQISKSTGELLDQSAFAPYYTDAALQQEAARVVRAAAKR